MADVHKQRAQEREGRWQQRCEFVVELHLAEVEMLPLKHCRSLTLIRR